MLIVGELINTSRKSIDEAVAKRDDAFIQTVVKAQIEAGAHLIDVNAGSRGTEIQDILWLINVIQESVQVRLSLDSSNPNCLIEAIQKVREIPMINSVSAEKSRFKRMIPVIEKRECDVVALCMDDRGVPKSVEQIIENAGKLLGDLEALGSKRERVYFDPVIQAVSTDINAGIKALDAIERIHREFPGTKTICGLSNISFALPKRRLVNRTFLALAMKAGLSAALIDPIDQKMMAMLRATTLLLGRDPYCKTYIKTFREGTLED
jgi:cobalamin-dependent methionine synthase I